VSTSLATTVPRSHGEPVSLPSPLLWFDPPWYRIDVDSCLFLADALTKVGITVACGQRDLFQQDDVDFRDFRRMVAHRCDRSGLLYKDLRDATIVDVRLIQMRDRHGRFAYPINQLRRWANQEETQVDMSIDAMLFPPEWISLDDMTAKIAQLRRLSGASVSVSIDECCMAEMLPPILRARADMLVIRTSGDPVASIVQAKQMLNASGGGEIPLWIVPTLPLSAEDCVKCFAMGASGIAIDAMFTDALMHLDDMARTTAQRAAISFGGSVESDESDRIVELVDRVVKRFIDDVSGFAHSCGVGKMSELNESHVRRR